jgi:hypothetical protein
MSNDDFWSFLGGAMFGLVIGVVLAGTIESDLHVCERTIQYQFDKTPEQVKAIIEQERNREGR